MTTPMSKFTPKTPRREKTTIIRTNSDSSLREPVSVFCRIRPLKHDSKLSCIKLVPDSPQTLAIITPTDSKYTNKEIHYKFEHVFTSYASQKEVFDHIAYPLLNDMLKGKNALLFSYGVTGSGKTFTLTGEPTNPGIMPRCIDTIFNTIGDLQAPKFTIKPDRSNGFEIQSESEAMQDRLIEVKASLKSLKNTNNKRVIGDKINYINDGTKVMDVNLNNLYSVFVSYIEIYNNIVYDLLDDSTGKSLQSKLLREDSQRNMFVNGMIEIEVKSAEEAFDVFNAGQKRKRMGHTILNSESSRSHSIFNIRLVQLEQVTHNRDGKPIIPDSNLLKIAQLSLVDLAGSERTNRTQNTGVRLKEASSINNSLMSLRTCLEYLRENQQTGNNKLVPYRDSRLTLLFKNYFEGEGKVEMIVCVNPSSEDYEENVHVLKFAEMTREVKLMRSENRLHTPYRKAISKHTSKTPCSLKIKSTPSFSMPKIPIFKFDIEKFDEMEPKFEKIAKILKMRLGKFNNANEDIGQSESHYRKRLCEIHQENVMGKTEIRSLKIVGKKGKQEVCNLKAKILELETTNDNLATKNEELQRNVRTLYLTINEKDMKINQKILEKDKTKMKLALASEKMSQELDMKLRKQREHLQAAMNAKDIKIKKMREVLDSEMEDNVCKEPEVIEPMYEPQMTPTQAPTTYRRNPQTVPRHRRSRSAGEVWLEHNSIKPVPLGTVLQPSVKKRKSVTKLSKASDITNPKQSKYCLIAQDQDTEGEIETKVYKGDIVPTCGGGAQVIFNDVELLTQKSPTATP